MHDILAHAVSLMVVQAEAGPVVVRRDPERAVATFDAIAGAGRDAMDQLRRMLDILKEDRDPRAPRPTIDDLPDLVRQVAGAGLEVLLRGVGRAPAAVARLRDGRLPDHPGGAHERRQARRCRPAPTCD